MKTKKPRLKKGTLVASTNPLNKIKCKRLTINVYFNDSYKIVKHDIKSLEKLIFQ